MNKSLLNPSFEFIFALGIIAMLILPPMVMAQDHKEIKVMINNGDTIVNGKNIKDLSSAQRKDALKDIEQVDKGSMHGPGRSMYMARVERFNHDSTGKAIEYRHNEMFRNQEDGPQNDRFRGKDQEDGEESRAWSFNARREPSRGPNRRNTQSFSYSSINNDGISTQVNFNVSDANRENMKRIAGAEKADLTINDLSLTPQFSTGKTMLSFALPEKGSADIQFKDSEGKVLWTDKASGSVTKSFELPQNGIYYLQVKQNGKLALRKIVKEQ